MGRLHYYLCTMILLELFHEDLKSNVFACTRMLTNQTFFEEITAKENTQYNFSFRPKDELRETAKDSVFIIEVKLCDNGNSHLVCRCRWISENISPCKNMGNVTICDVYNSEMLLSMLIKRSYRDLMWELYRHNSAPRVVKLTSLHVRYPANVTGLQVNGQEVNQTRVIDEKQEVSVSCFFTNGNPLVSVRLMDDTGRAQSSTTHGQGPLTLSLGQFRCQDVWPSIKCEAPESEHNRSVVIFGKCPPQFLHTDTQVLALRRVLQEGLTLGLRSYTSDIKKCHMTRLSPQPAYIEVTCGLAGSAPEFNLTLRFTADSYIGEGIWMLHAITEAGSSNITFMITNNTSEFGNQGPAMTSGNKKLNTILHAGEEENKYPSTACTTVISSEYSSKNNFSSLHNLYPSFKT